MIPSATNHNFDIPYGGSDNDWLQSLFPDWQGEEQAPETRKDSGSDQVQQQKPHPAFADAAQMKQQAQSSALYSQGMDQTLFRSQLHRHSPYEQPQQQAQIQSQQHTQPHEPQPRDQQQHQANVQYQSQHQPSHPPPQQLPQQPPQQPIPNQHDQLHKYYREALDHRQARALSTPSPQEDRTQPPLQQYQYREASNEQQYVRPSDINPHVSYYQPSSTSQLYARRVSMPSSLPAQRSTPSPTLAQPPHATSRCPVEANSRPPTGSPSQKAYASTASQHAAQQNPSVALSQPPLPAPSAQRNSTPVITQQVSDARPKIPPRAPSQAQPSSKQQEPPRRGSFIEDTTIGSTSPQKDPYTSASRSTLGRRVTSTYSASMAANPTLAPAPARPKKSPVVSHAHPSPKPRDSGAKSATMSVSASACPSVPAAAQRPTPGSPAMNANSAGPATDTGRPSTAASTTSSSSQGPAVPSLLNAIPPALPAHVTPQMLKTDTPSQKLQHTAPSQFSAQTSLSTSTSSASPVVSKPTVASTSQTPKSTVNSTPTTRGTFASAASVNSKPTVPAAQQTAKATARQLSAPTARSIPTSASPINSKPTGSAVSQLSKSASPYQSSVSTPRSVSAPSVPRTNSGPDVTAEQQAPKATAPSQSYAPVSCGTSATASSIHSEPTGPAVPPLRGSAPTARNVSTSSASPAEPTPAPTAGPQMPRAINSPQHSASISRGISASSASSVNSTTTMHARPQMTKATISSQIGAQPARSTSSSLGPPDNFTPFLSTSTPVPADRSQPSTSQSAADSRTPSQGMPPTAGHQPARGYAPQPRPAPKMARLTTATAFNPVQRRYGHPQPQPVSTQLPAAKMRKLVDGSRHAVTAPSKTLDLAQYVRQSPSRKHITYRGDIVDMINASNVAIKVNYDPATIARDILIVADRHPTEKSLNHHLHVLRQNFVAVNYESDLATFRWDIVDPYVYYPPGFDEEFSKLEGNQTSTTILRTRPDSIAQPPSLLDLPNLTAQAGPAGPAWNNRPHVVARDSSAGPLAHLVESRPIYNTVPGTTRIGPTSIGTTGTTSARTTTYVTAGAGSQSLHLGSTAGTGLNTARFGTIGQLPTGADTAQTGATNNHHVRSSCLAQPTTPAIARTSTLAPTAHKPIPTPPSAVNLNAFAALPFKPPPYYSPLRPTGQPIPYSLSAFPPATSSQDVPPPVSVEFPALSQPSPTVSVSISRSPAKVKSVPSASPSKRAETGPLPQLSQAASDSPRGKHSRKSSLPKGLPEPQVVIPCSSEAMTLIKRKPGRPPKTAVQVKVAIDDRPAPQYQVFPCKWTKCDAELHSLQAIESHVVGVHIPHHITCAWEGCTDQTPRAAAAMWDHVKDDHMRPLAWQLGDGPAATVTVADGNESAQTFTQGRHDIMTLPADRDLVKIFSRTHGTQTPKQKAQLMYEGGRRWKEGAGPELDASDRSLSNPTRLLSSSHAETAYTVSEVRVVI